MAEDSNVLNIIHHTLINIITESSQKAFTSEDQIHGYMLGILREHAENYRLRREVPTSIPYTKNGDGTLKKGKGRRGNIDLWLESDSCSIGIELE